MVTDTLTAWAARHPDTLRFFDELNRRGVRWGLFSGAHVQFLPNARPTNDNDLLTDCRGFDVIAGLSDVAVADKTIEPETLDKATIRYTTQEATIELDGTVVQVMRPVDMVCSNGATYNLAMTDLAASRRLACRVGDTVVYVAHPFDTVLAKGVLQRPDPKHDAADAAALAMHYDLLADPLYVVCRAREVGADQRVADFVAGHTGLALGLIAAAAAIRQPVPV